MQKKDFRIICFLILFTFFISSVVLSAFENGETETWESKAIKLTEQIPDPASRTEVLNNIKLGNITSIEQIETLVKEIESDLVKKIENIDGLKDEALKAELHNKTKDHTALGYKRARKAMYGSIDKLNLDNGADVVFCVYSRKIYNSGDKQRTGTNTECVVIDEDVTEDSSIKFSGNNNKKYKVLVGKELAVHPKGQTDGFLNCEHTWPQSQFKKKEPMRSDLHHIFPTDSIVNAVRCHYAFGYAQNPIWQRYGCSLGTDSQGRDIFEPRDDHKGNVARAMFYFSVRYQTPIKDFEEKVLREWNKKDPVDNRERRRNGEIEKIQKNRNPFVDQPELVDSITDF